MSRLNCILVHPRTSEIYSKIETTYEDLPPASPLPLIACATEARLVRECLTASIRVVDRPIITDDLVLRLAQADVVGLTVWFSNCGSAIEIARSVKKENPETQIVFGGPDAANLNRRLLCNNNCIDYVVVGDGEDSLWRLMAGQEVRSIPNLWYRCADGITRFTFRKHVNLDSLGTFDFRHVEKLDLTAYDSRRSGYRYNPSLLPISLNWTRGCPRAAARERCAYCSLPAQGLRLMSPDKAWAQAHHLHELYGIDWFFEGGDDITSGNYAECLLRHPARLRGVSLRSYCGLEGLRESKVRTLRELGVTELFVGVETTDAIINRWSGHVVTQRGVQCALESLRDHGISICIPFMFGLPGESKESLAITEQLACDLVDRYANIRMVLVSLAMPLIGSQWFAQLAGDASIRAGYGEVDLRTIDVPDYARLAELSIEKFCSASLEEILVVMDRTRSRLASRVTTGCFGALDEILLTRLDAVPPKG